MNEHPDRLAILAFIEDDELIDREAIASHLATCEGCRNVLADLEELAQALSDGLVFQYLDDHDPDREALRADLAARAGRDERAAESADAFFADLMRRSIESWDSFLADNPHQRTAALVRRLIAEVTLELDRRPEYALELLDAGEQIAYGLYDAESRFVLGDLWKQRSNALRMLARYEEAIDAAEIAEAFYASLANGEFDVGQAQYTRGLALFKMMRYGAALEALKRARATLEPFGESAPLMKTSTLEAGIRFDQGDVEGAYRIWQELVPGFERAGDRLEVARVRANLAACNQRLGQYDAALMNARAAIEIYQSIGNEAEGLRVGWTVALVKLARNEDAALDELMDVASAFETLGMYGDAGFVQLDIVEELLRRDEWAEAEVTARQLVKLFTDSGVALAKITALDFLRQAVAQREATEATVQYVRDFILVDDPAEPFVPPFGTEN